MSPEEFVNKWQIDKKELAKLLSVSYPVVERWFFVSGKNKRDPKANHLNRLSEIDYILETLNQCQKGIDSCPTHIKDLLKKVGDSHQIDVN